MKVKSFFAGCFILFCFSASSAVQATTRHAPPTVWEVLRKQFVLEHEVNRPEVQAQLRWLVNHPDYLKRFAQAEPYIYHIMTEVKKRNLPGEIALVPIIESAFDPFAYSGVGAAGLWQIMPATGKDFGLNRDWWIDPRRDVTTSTEAALKYYSYLNKFFHGNWLLAIAAYDSGEGNVARAVRRNGKSKHNATFWSLRLPQETRTYIPRLLALAEIIQHPARYHVVLPNIPHKPYFKAVDVGQQIDLSHAAKLADIPYQDFIKLNPGYNRWATAPYQPYKLLLPIKQAKSFRQKLTDLPENQRLGWSRHQVRSGESLGVIAQEYRTTSELIKKLNHLKSDTLHAGQYVLVPNQAHVAEAQQTKMPAIPTPNIPAQNTYKVVHIVQKHDSFERLEQRYGTNEKAVRAWNHLGEEHPIQPGQELLIWKQRGAGGYKVKPGDSLSRIASKNKVPLRRILALNPEIKEKHVIRPGQTLQLS